VAGRFYIHIADPGFPEPPWPGERRLGPYNTREEAEAQAVSDAAGGYAVALGIYEEGESHKRAVQANRGKAVVTRAKIKSKGETEAKRRHKERQKNLDSDVRALAEMLPTGMGMEEAALLLQGDQQTVIDALQKAADEAAGEAVTDGAT